MMTQPEKPKIEDIESKEALKSLAAIDADAWVDYYNIVNEKGEPIEWTKHHFQRDIYNDQSQNLCVMKAAQIGMSTLEILKNIRDAERRHMDIIYTLPTDTDVHVFVGGKVNRIIKNNPYLTKLTADKDSVEQKQIGDSMIYFRGTWTKKAAIMVTADRLVHDEKDSSKQDVVAEYQARLQHSKYKEIHVFSHPSVPNVGVDVEWNRSDQKEWFITCPYCNFRQMLTWNTEDPKKMSINIEKQRFECKKCHKELGWKDRALGEWRPKKGKEGAEYSGYHVSLLIAPWVTAKEIIKKYNDSMKGTNGLTMDWFYNKVIGLPYAGSGNSVTEEIIKGAVTDEQPRYENRLIIGVDTGLNLRFVYGDKYGLYGYGEVKDYMPDQNNGLELNETLEYFLKKFPNSIMVVDQGGDIIGSRKLRKKYPGRVFLCHYARDRKTMQLIRWGDDDESGNVIADRNRMIQLLVDEFTDKRPKLYRGNREDWHEYWLHWSHIYRVKEENSLGTYDYKWLRSDRDDWVHATVYWRIGVSKFGGQGGVYGAEDKLKLDSYVINPDNTVGMNPDELFGNQEDLPDKPWWDTDEEDWRNDA